MAKMPRISSLVWGGASCLFSTVLLQGLTEASAQYHEENFILYTVRNGVSENLITSLQQDDRGYIWIGTDNGLNRFDGYTFEKFFQGQQPLYLPSSGIRRLLNFGNHQLGIITRGGFKVLNTKNYTVYDYSLPGHPAFSVQRNAVWDVKSLHDTGYLLSTKTGIYAFDKNRNLSFHFDGMNEQDVFNSLLIYGRNIFPISNEEFLIYLKNEKLGHFKPAEKIFRELKEADSAFSIFQSFPTTGYKWSVYRQLGPHEFIFISRGHDSIVYYNLAVNKWVISPLPRHYGQSFNWESHLAVFSDSLFAINHADNGFSFFTINRKSGIIRCHSKKILPRYKITCFFIDRDKRLWIGTTQGVLMQKTEKKFLRALHISPIPDELTGAYYTCGFRYKDKFYIGRFSRNFGLTILDTAGRQAPKHISFFGNNSPWNEIRSIQMYHPDTLWLGANGGLIWFDTKTNRYGKLADLEIYAGIHHIPWILAPPRPDGYAWLSGYLSGIAASYHIETRTFSFFTQTTAPALPFTKTKYLAYDAYGDVWLSGHALARWNNKKQLFDTLITVYEGFNKYNDDILTISADSNGSLWLHNAYNGLLQYIIKEKKFIPYAMTEGLPSVTIRCLSPVSDNLLWLASNDYLVRFDIRSKKLMVFDYRDGFPESSPTNRIMYHDRESGWLYFFCKNTVVKFPAHRMADYPVRSHFILEEILVQNHKKYYYPESRLQLKAGMDNLLLRFTAIDFENGEKYKFAYRLYPSSEWINAGSQRQINLVGLSSGLYELYIKCTDTYGEENVSVFHFSIAYPFWKTSWFIAGIIILIVSLAYLLYRYRIWQIRQKASLDKLLSQTEMKALHAQMNPHFIFNSLNSIREMILSNENRKASKYLSKFARLIRMTLDQSSKSFISLQNTVEYLNSYIEMEQIRNNRFSFSIQVDEALDQKETVLPPMLIQPFIENAIWHGTNGTSDTISIVVGFKKKGDSLLCIIDDNGIGIDESLKKKSNSQKMHNPVGIANIQNRIRLLNEKYRLRCSLTIEDKSRNGQPRETGTRITLELPINLSDV